MATIEQKRKWGREWRNKNRDRLNALKRADYRKNREKYLAIRKKYRDSHKEECRLWSKFSYIRNKETYNRYSKKYRFIHKDELKQRKKEYNLKRKINVMQHYSNKEIPECKLCGQKDIRYLSVDHINGFGEKHRQEINKSGIGFYNWLIKNNYPEGYQILCIACNMAKSRTY